MSEEEIKEIIKDFLELREIHSSDSVRKSYLSIYQEAIQGLLDLYQAEKEKNIELEQYKHDAELTKVACCVGKNCEALNNCIRTERELQAEKEKNNFIITNNLNDKYEEVLNKTFVKYINKHLEKDFISKDKIKNTIKQINEELQYFVRPETIDTYKFTKKVLENLLEE